MWSERLAGRRAAQIVAAAAPRGPLAGWVWLVAGVQLAAFLATSTRYGYHRDELYFIVAGSHPAFGYPDQPPLIPLLTWAMNAIAPRSVFVLRLPSAAMSCTTTVLAALVARELGGTRRAQTIAAACTAVSGIALALGHFVTTTTPDLLSTTALCFLMVRAVVRRSGPSTLAAGVVVGIGFEAKPQVGLVAAVIVVALALVGPRWPLRSWWTLAGAAAAIGLAAPYLVWQQAHGWPQVTVAHNIAGSQEGGRAGFIPFQLVMVSPVLVPVWIAGLVLPFRRPEWRVLRFLPVTYGLVALAYLVGNGHAYYQASLYPALLGLGALPIADWTLRGRARTGLLAAAVALSAVVSGVIALPLLPADKLQGSAVMKLNPAQGETVGWPQFIDAVARAWRRVPPATRRGTAIFTQNYGEAGAIDVLGRVRGLPPAYSAHNGFSEWGKPPASDRQVLLVGYGGPAAAAPAFAGCRSLAVVDNGVGLANDEQGLPIQLCRPTAPWSSLWPSLVHFN